MTKPAPVPFWINTDAEPNIPDGYTLIDHRRYGQILWTPDSVYLYQDMPQEHKPGSTLYERLRGKRVANATTLGRLLRRPGQIPKEWKCNEAGETIYIHFWGTLFRDRYGNRWVKYLFWNMDEQFWDWSMSNLSTSHHGHRSYAAVLN
jgi:hypothetical protein